MISPQTQVRSAKRKANLPRLTSGDATVITTDLDYDTSRSDKRKRHTDAADDLGVSTNYVSAMAATEGRTSRAVHFR